MFFVITPLITFTFGCVPRSASAREGYIEVPGGKVWYRIVGSGNAVQLLLLHGGPGFPSDYLKLLEALADERPVIFYDQLGCGKSDRPDDTTLWRVERFMEELKQVRRALGLQKVHIHGHSWGTMLATDYALTRPEGLVSLILASPALSIPRWLKDQKTYFKALPEDIQDVIQRHEKVGTIDSEEYQSAVRECYRRHVCRLNPWPAPLDSAFAGFGLNVYLKMWGPAEFTCTGDLKDYDRTSRLKELSLPVLFTCGRYDEATPEATAMYQSLVPDSKLKVFEKSSHMMMLEEPEGYVKVVRDFLRQVEQQ